MEILEKIILNGLEGRRLEFKASFPMDNKIAKTAIAFSNGVGGKIILGVRDTTREVVGIEEQNIFKLEEQISQSIFDNCYPTIIPELTIHTYKNKTLIVVTIYPGNDVPYFLKTKGRKSGVYIRVGSSNRIANDELIAELERRKRHISFDSLPVLDYQNDLPELKSFKRFYQDKTGRELGKENLLSMELLKQERETIFPTNALLLLAEKETRKIYFPFAQIECARFKGVSTAEIIDQSSCDASIILQAEEAIKFIKRNIAKFSTIGDIYRNDKWEYPLEAIREAVINAIIHRDYSILGSDIKIAIFDDMLEITSPGTLMPSFDLNDMSNNPSEIRNKILAPIFKSCSLIEKWGSGFKKILEQMKNYPELELKILEPSNATQIQFIKKDFVGEKTRMSENAGEMSEKTKVMSEKIGRTSEKIIGLIQHNANLTIGEMSDLIGVSTRTIERNINKLQQQKQIKRIGSDRKGYWKVLFDTDIKKTRKLK